MIPDCYVVSFRRVHQVQIVGSAHTHANPYQPLMPAKACNCLISIDQSPPHKTQFAELHPGTCEIGPHTPWKHVHNYTVKLYCTSPAKWITGEWNTLGAMSFLPDHKGYRFSGQDKGHDGHVSYRLAIDCKWVGIHGTIVTPSKYTTMKWQEKPREEAAARSTRPR